MIIGAVIENNNDKFFFILGDFNAHPNELFCNELISFCNYQDRLCSDMEKFDTQIGKTNSFVRDL